MPQFLIRSLTEASGFQSVKFDQLPRSRTESYVPWALTHDNRVVYAATGEHTSWRGGGGAGGALLKPYDSLASQNRRRLAESALGMLALEHPAFTQGAVDLVTRGIQGWMDQLYLTKRKQLTDAIYEQIGHYFYTDGGMGFGRISTGRKEGLGADGVRRGIFNALAKGRLDQKLAIHDAIGRKLLPLLGGPQLAVWEQWGPVLRQGWFDDRAKRGRVAVKQVPGPTLAGGIADSGSGLGTVAISRTRGIDGVSRDLHRTRQHDADRYYDDLDERNLLFGAGISGTTGTLLQAAFAFGGVLRGEPLKQYVLAIIGYLVGGGMHSYHESMAVAGKAGLPYMPGAFLPSLPQSFLMSRQGTAWREQYHDVVVLGATHWRNNAGALPSHLNRNLRSA